MGVYSTFSCVIGGFWFRVNTNNTLTLSFNHTCLYMDNNDTISNVLAIIANGLQQSKLNNNYIFL